MRVLLLAFLLAASLAAGTTGNIKGTVIDEKNEPIGGVTVVATSTALQGEQVAMTDENGLYLISNLPAGIYTLKAMFAEAASELKGIEVYIEKTVNANLTIKMDQAKGEVYQITEKATHIDVASSTVGVTLTKDYIQNVPMGRDRNFSNAMNALPSSGKDAGGDSVGGATSPENVYIIDGVNATDPSSGLSGTRMVLEFVDQFDVKEGGYGPELGRATGGVVNAGTKSGSNDFHGSVFGYYRPGFLQAVPRSVSRVADSLTRRNKLDFYLNVGAELGGPIIKDKLWFHIGYSPELQRDNWIRDVRQIKADANNNPAKDANDQLIFDDNIAYSDQFAGFGQTHQYTFKLSHAIDNNNRHSLGVRGAPTFFDGSIGSALTAGPGVSLNGDPSTFQYKTWGGNLVTGVYTYAGKYFNDKLKLDATMGVHHQQNHYWPTHTNGNKPRVTYMQNNLGLDTVWDGGSLAACEGTFADKSPKCLARNYAKGGLGSFEDSQLTRISEKLILTSLYDFAGLHQLKYGVDLEQLRGSGTHGYTGGSVYTFNTDGSLNETQYNVRGSGTAGKIPNLAQTLDWGAFAGDSWNPTPNLTINYGLRWEAQEFYGVAKPALELDQLSLQRKFSILDNWAPRAGVVWDFLGNGKGALRFNYGRYYESVPMTINQRAFGGEGSRVRVWDKAGCKPGSTIDQDDSNKCKTGPVDDKTLGSQDSIVAPGMKGQYSDEFVLSADYEPFNSWVFGVAGVYRYLGRVIEDMSTDGGSTYMFGNPGSFDVNSLDGVRDQINHTSDPAERARLEQTINTLSRINEFPRPVRNIWQLQFRVDKKVSDHFMILATYVLSWAHGNYPGLITANNGQLDPNLSSQFDLPQLVVNRMGFLPQDQRHRIKLSGFYKAALKDFGINSPFSFTLGLSGGVQSGMPYETLGRDQFYGNDEVFLLPRGSGGRTPWTWSIDLNIGAGYEITDGITAELFAALYNITNNQDPVAYDDTYTYDTVRPIVNGDKDQLSHARNMKGNPITKNPNYGQATAFQMPFSAQVGFRLKF